MSVNAHEPFLVSQNVSSYALTELQKDVEKELKDVPEAERDAQRTKFAIFVVHNKLKPKLATIPDDIP